MIEAQGNAKPTADRQPARLGLVALERAVRSAEPAALLVLPRILRRVIKQDRRPRGPALTVPHRQSHVIGREPLLEIVDKSELGLDADYPLPEQVILLARPDPDELAAMTADAALLHCWRLLLHARVHVVLEQQLAAGKLDAAAIRRRIQQIGLVAFDEVRTVLQQDARLLPPRSDATVYVEFAAVYLELRYFAWTFLPRYFPAIADFRAIDDVLAQDLDAGTLFVSTRPPRAPDPQDHDELSTIDERAAESEPATVESTPAPKPSEETYRRLMRRAQRPAALGNVVRSAIFRARAARCAPPEWAERTRTAIKTDVSHLMYRLRAALELDDQSPQQWQGALFALVHQTPRGVWTVEARLLYDLQKVCVDYEREIYTVDVVEWVLSWGKRPVKRPLPSQRDVLMCKHLRSAARRLSAVRLNGVQRQQLSALIEAAIERVEQRIRSRFRPLIDGTLREVGLEPQNLPENVALRKLVEELLDQIVERGFLRFGDLRDALSRNNLKLPDVAAPVDYLRGDQLLRADRRLAIVLDGVYHRGEFYLRWLQRFSALAFGTRTGRFLTRYAAVPFGGAALVLGGLEWICEAILKRNIDLLTGSHVLYLGLALLALIYVGPLRRALWQAIKTTGRAVRGLVVDPIVRLVRWPLLQAIFRSRPFRLCYRFVLKPLVWTLLLWLVFPLEKIDWGVSTGSGVSIFLAVNLLLNSRIGRSLEEMATDWLVQTWQRYGLRLVSGLVYFLLDFFKVVLETIERLMYTVDEWLRFKSGESPLALLAKAALGAVWFYVAYVVRFCIMLLIEPQVNPIKHFPVVTVSHKIMWGFCYVPFGDYLEVTFGLEKASAYTIAGVILFLVPGIFGFLVWELQENWRLYAANRRRRLRPIPIGSHGETMARLLKPGFHSGTIPKRFAKLRHAEHKARETGDWKVVRKQFEALHQVEQSVRRYLQRELLPLLAESHCINTPPVAIAPIHLATNSIRIVLRVEGETDAELTMSIATVAGWLLAGIDKPGWADRLSAEQQQALVTIIVGLYKSAGIDLVRQQIESHFSPPVAGYDFDLQDLVVVPDETFQSIVLYDLCGGDPIVPRVTAGQPRRALPILAQSQLLFSEVPLFWQQWIEVWQQDQAGQCHPRNGVVSVRVL